MSDTRPCRDCYYAAVARDSTNTAYCAHPDRMQIQLVYERTYKGACGRSGAHWVPVAGPGPLDDIRKRYEALRERLEKNFPDICEEQAHLDGMSREKAYWEYGYAVALRDVLNLLSRTSRLN